MFAFPARIMLPAIDYVQSHGDGIHVIDTGFHRPHFDASYLLVEDGHGAFVDTGTNHAVPRLLAALDHVGLAREDVDWVIATHVHLDHAGGVGLLMRHLPNARLVVHPRGARHLVDPSRLMASARGVYGDAEVERSYGEVVGVPVSRVLTTHDDMQLEWRGRPLRFIDTPGHARHHHCIWDERTRGWFTGDTFGLSYREFDTTQGAWMLPTTTPVQFEPDLLARSVQRLLDAQPQWLYLTHYGAVADPGALGRQFFAQLDDMVRLARSFTTAPDRHAALSRALASLYLRRLRDHGVTMDDAAALELLALDIELNAQGMSIWLDKHESAATR
jgi:glyoxylase-like metal-dependent hydrolase (beta-lactamase superfamily II)